jgi:hypothetical protein
MWSPMGVRLELRQTFERYLSKRHHQSYTSNFGEMVDELCLLNLCKYYRLEYPGGAEDIAKIWDKSEQRIADGGPTFDELKRLGWILFDGGRWIMQRAPLGTNSYINYPSTSTKNFLMELGKVRLVAKTESPSPDARTLADKILAENWLESNIPTEDPEWLAGQLWEHLLRLHLGDSYSNVVQAANSKMREDHDIWNILEFESEAVDKTFLEWVAWCHVLGCPSIWNIGWKPFEMQCCHEAAHRVLSGQFLWDDWENDVSRYAELLEKTFAIPQDKLRYSGPPRRAPRTLVSQSDWLGWHDIESFMCERMLGWSTVSFAFGLLCSELENTDIKPNIDTAAEKLLSFVADHPLALQHLLFRVDAAPALLVDMIMNPRVASLAAKLIIKWPSRIGGNLDRKVSREAQTREYAVQDALSLLAYHLDRGALDIEECASLISWCYDSVNERAIADGRWLIGHLLLETSAREEKELQSSLLQHLVDQSAYDHNVPRVRFAGVLNGLNLLKEATGYSAFPLVTLYIKFARDLNLDWTDASKLSVDQAARLVATAIEKTDFDGNALLIPFDSTELLRNSSGDERASKHSSVARTLRVHVLLLARAVAGWRDKTVPKRLSDALITLISRSVIDYAEKGWVAALTSSYRPFSIYDGQEASPALELTAAWRKLGGVEQRIMLQALAKSDDPALLAELCQHLPLVAKGGIQARLRQLNREEASKLWTWPDLQHRIKWLIIAGEYELAREHFSEIQDEVNHAPTELRLSLFELELQLLLKEKNWTALDGADIPSSIDSRSGKQARELLDFYRATSQLLRPNGDLAKARNVMNRLAKLPGAPAAYKVNAFAIAIQQLLGPSFRSLHSEEKRTGEELLTEINATVAPDERNADDSLLVNRALLLHALQRPTDALESLATRRKERPSVDIEHTVVFIKSEMGLTGEAMAILDAAITEFGDDERLIAAKRNLQSSDFVSSVVSASAVVDLTSSIRAALQQLSELPPSLVGEILGPTGRGLRGYLIRQVSLAVTALQHMAAMLRDRKNLNDGPKLENDLNTAVREVLGALLSVPKWNVSDQSLGGANLNGNPGERDAVIRISNQEISIYEALVCFGLDRVNIKSHFDKLLSYGVCDIYFHVIYSYAKEFEDLLCYIREMLENEIPSALTYRGCEPLIPPDYETSGYLATYRVDHRELAVVFFVVDLRTKRSSVAELFSK